MQPDRFNAIARRLTARRTRRQALRDTGLAAGALAATGLAAGVASAVAQDATPEAVPAEPWAGEKTPYLFVQSFESGSIVPIDGEDGRYTVTLEQGTGQTVYFADRPSRDVGATETPQFLEGLGFPEDNPPNAAILTNTGEGENTVAVVELFNPLYDPETRGVTYEVEVLEHWKETADFAFGTTPVDIDALGVDFGATHVFIDDCPAITVTCNLDEDDVWTPPGTFYDLDACWNYSLCYPCEPYGHVQPNRCATPYYWQKKCNDTFSGCKGKCLPTFSWEFTGTGCF